MFTYFSFLTGTLVWIFAQFSFAVSCNVPHDLPLVTHYDATIQAFRIGGIDPPAEFLFNSLALQEYRSGKPYVYLYAKEFIPGQEKGLADRFDDQTFSSEFVTNRFNEICKSTGVAYQLIQPNTEINQSEDFLKVISPQINAQVIHSLIFRNNLFSIILPPNWNPKGSTKYPLLINGFYGLNVNLLNQEGPHLMRLLADLYNNNQTGGIGLLWNGGAAIGSFTTADKNYQDLNDFLNIMIPILNIDRENAITFGGSRGAYTALNIASHHLVTAVKVKYVSAINPFDKIQLINSLMGTNIFQLLSIREQTTGYYGAWHKDFVNPNGDRVGIVTDEANLSLPEKLKKLVKNGTQILMYVGTHDNIVPTVAKLKLFEAYRRKGIPVEMKLFYFNGHLADRELRDQDLADALLKLGSKTTQPKLIKRNKISAFLLDESGTNNIIKKSKPGLVPLLIEIPRYINDSIPSQFVAKGKPNSKIKLIFLNENKLKYEVNFKLDRTGYWIHKLDNSSLPYGELYLESVTSSVNKIPLHYLKSSLPIGGKLQITHSKEDPRNLQDSPVKIIMNLLYGKNQEFALKRNQVPATVNNGIIIFNSY